jgi:APA family basic amino acid/polyamine antiporter
MSVTTPSGKAGALQRTLGLGPLAFYGIGLTLGAGIYSILGAAAGQAGEALWMSLLLGAFVATLTGMSYAELATMWPRAGAEHTYAQEAWPKAWWVAGPLGWLLFASSFATGATVAVAFAGYAHAFVPWPEWTIAIALIVAAGALNLIGIEASSRVNVVFTSIETAGLIALVAVGLREPDFFASFAAPPHAGVLTGAGLIFFAFLGFEGIARLAGEARDPGRDLPRAIQIAIVVSTALYVAVALAAVALLEPAKLAASHSPLADAIAAGAPQLRGALGAVALFATANTALIALLGASRLLYGMAEGGSAPRAFAAVSGRRKTPVAATIAAVVGSLALLPLGGVEVVGAVASLTALLAFLVVNIAVIWLRRTKPRAKRPYRVRFAVAGVPLPAAIGALASLLLMATIEARAWAVFAVVLAGGLLLARRTAR